jgi:hypothetical protein
VTEFLCSSPRHPSWRDVSLLVLGCVTATVHASAIMSPSLRSRQSLMHGARPDLLTVSVRCTRFSPMPLDTQGVRLVVERLGLILCAVSAEVMMLMVTGAPAAGNQVDEAYTCEPLASVEHEQLTR